MTRAEREALFLRLIAQRFLPAPVREYKFALSEGRQFAFDFAWLSSRVALEVEGGVHTGGAHGSVSGILRDMEKYSLAAALGWRVVRVKPAHLCDLERLRILQRAIEWQPPPAPDHHQLEVAAKVQRVLAGVHR